MDVEVEMDHMEAELESNKKDDAKKKAKSSSRRRKSNASVANTNVAVNGHDKKRVHAQNPTTGGRTKKTQEEAYTIRANKEGGKRWSGICYRCAICAEDLMAHIRDFHSGELTVTGKQRRSIKMCKCGSLIPNV